MIFFDRARAKPNTCTFRLWNNMSYPNLYAITNAFLVTFYNAFYQNERISVFFQFKCRRDELILGNFFPSFGMLVCTSIRKCFKNYVDFWRKLFLWTRNYSVIIGNFRPYTRYVLTVREIFSDRAQVCFDFVLNANQCLDCSFRSSSRALTCAQLWK